MIIKTKKGLRFCLMADHMMNCGGFKMPLMERQRGLFHHVRKSGMILLSCLSLFLGVPASASTPGVSLARLAATGLAVVVVETVGGEEPTCEYLSVDSGYSANTIKNATKVPGRVVVVEGHDTIYDSGDYDGSGGGMTIKMRGNNSAFRKKHPFKLKLQHKADMLCRHDDGKYADRDWLLLDGSTLNMMTGMAVNRLVGLQWTPAFRYVNLLFNGDYRGIYILSDAVERNPHSRLNVDKNEGFIVERDPLWWNEDVYFEAGPLGHQYTFKYPDSDDITEERVSSVQQRIDQWERAVADGTYDEYCDVESFAAWLLAHDILGTQDAAGSNIFLTCYDTESKICLGNIWDLDTNYYREDRWAVIHEWWGFPIGDMLRSENPAFSLAFLNKWDEEEPRLFNRLDNWLRTFLRSDEYEALENSRRLENDSIGYRFPTILFEVQKARQWFAHRERWLRHAMAHFRDEVLKISAIDSYTVEEKHTLKNSYDLQGHRFAAPLPRGLYIQGGRKCMMR